MRMSTIPKFLLMYRIDLKSKQVLKKHDRLEKKTTFFFQIIRSLFAMEVLQMMLEDNALENP